MRAGFQHSSSTHLRPQLGLRLTPVEQAVAVDAGRERCHQILQDATKRAPFKSALWPSSRRVRSSGLDNVRGGLGDMTRLKLSAKAQELGAAERFE